MKLKVYALYTAGLALMIGAVSVGDGRNALPPSAWGGQAIASVLMAAAALICWGFGRGIEIERADKARLRRINRTHARSAEPDYRSQRKEG